MTDVPKIAQGRVVNSRDFVWTAISDLAERAGGMDELRKLLDFCDAMPLRALEIALRRSRIEYIMASLGESLVGMSVLMGTFWLTYPRSAPSIGLVVKLLVPAVVTLALHILIQRRWHASWYKSTLYPAFKSRSREQVVSAALRFYKELAPQMTIPGTIFYPLTTGITLGLVDAPLLAWGVLVPFAVIVGAAVNRLLYFTRLLHTDLCEWAGAFSMKLTHEDEREIREARKGTGLYRYVWEEIEARGYASVSRFEVYILAQCALGILAAVVICMTLVGIEDSWQRSLVVAPLAPGLLAVGCSYFMRFVFLNRRQQSVSELDAGQEGESVHPTPAYESLAESGIDAQSRLLRKAML